MDKEYTPAEAKAWLAGYDAGKPQAKKEWKVLTESDINKIIESTVENLSFEAKNKNMMIQTELAPLYPIQLDPVLMNRVISNLIENAIKYAGNGKRVEIKTWDEPEWVFVEIKDNGVGLGTEELNHIFDKF